MAGGRRPIRGTEERESLPTTGGTHTCKSSSYLFRKNKLRFFVTSESIVHMMLIKYTCSASSPGARLVSRETTKHENSTWWSDAVCPSSLHLSGGQKWRREKESSGSPAHLHDAPRLRQDDQGYRETQSTQNQQIKWAWPQVLLCGCFLFCFLFFSSRWLSLFFSLQPSSKDQVLAMLEKARAVMPAKPAAPAKAGGGKSSSEPSRSASGLYDIKTNDFQTCYNHNLRP